jgi:hypothetical protein
MDFEPLGTDPETELTVVTLADVTPERVTWLWPQYLPVGKLVIHDGDPSTGKSTLSLDLAARVSTGKPWPDGTDNAEAGHVLLLSAEDGAADTIRPRLDAAGADVSRVHLLTGVPVKDDDGNIVEVPPSLPRDVPHLRKLVERLGVRLVVVDVLMAYLSSGTDSYRDQDVRGALAPLARMAEETGCCVLLIRHLSKTGGTHALYRGGGSIGIVGAARAAYLVGRDPDDDGRRVMACTKSNLAAEPPTLAYRLVDSSEHGCARVEWESGPVKLTAADLLRLADPDERTEARAIDAWLVEALRNGPQPSRQVMADAEAQGWSKTSTMNARKRLGVVPHKDGMAGGWTLSLPEESGEESEEPQPRIPDSSDPLEDALDLIRRELNAVEITEEAEDSAWTA